MATVIIVDGDLHHSHPEKGSSDTFVTFCGEEIGRSEADHIASGARYAEPFAAEVSQRENAEICDECTHESSEWAEPN